MADKQHWTAAQMIDALQANAGIKSAAARRLGCHLSTIDNYIDRYPTVRQAYEEARAGIVDMAESVVVRRVNAGEWDAAKFILTTLGKDRGWITKQEHEHSGRGGSPLIFTIALERPDDDGDSTE
jgi:hypothetical protein